MPRVRFHPPVWLSVWGLLLALLAPVAGRAQSPPADLDELRGRIERLEKMNQQLLERLESVGAAAGVPAALGTPRPAPQPTGQRTDTPPEVQPPAAEPQGPARAQLQKMVDEYLEGKEAERRKAEEKKSAEKKQEDEKKKREEEAKKQQLERNPEWYEVGSDPAMKVKWDGHPTLYTANKDFVFQFTGRLHWDTGWFTQSGGYPDVEDASVFRRARIGFQGVVWENIYFRTAYDFANSSNLDPISSFKDAYIGVAELPWLGGNLTVGQQKEPLSLSWMSTSNGLVFLERPLPVNAFIPDRNNGILWNRTYLDGRVWVGTGFFRNLTSINGFSRGDGQYAWSGRVTALPYWADGGRRLVHVGGYYSHRAFGDDNWPSFNDRPEVRLGLPAVVSTGQIVGAQDQDLAGAEFVTVLGPFSLQGEFIYTNVNGTFTKGQGLNPNYWGAYVFASYFLTGENRIYSQKAAAFSTPVPYENFFWYRDCGRSIFGRGAWEVAARWSILDLRDPGQWFAPTSSAGAGGTGVLNTCTAGLNWYLNPQTTLQFDYVHAWRDSDTPGRNGQSDEAAVRVRYWW